MEQTQTADRTRTYSWGDPTAGLGRLRSISRLEMLRAVADGSLPVAPALRTLAVTGVQSESGRVVFAMTPQERHSLDLSVTFLRAARPGSGELTCTGQVVSRSTRTSFARAEVHDPRGRLMAHATSTCLLMSDTD